MEPRHELNKLVGGTINKLGRMCFRMLPMDFEDVQGESSEDQDDQFRIYSQSASKNEEELEFLVEKQSHYSAREEKNEKTQLQVFFERATKNDEDQIVMLADVQKTGKKIQFPETVNFQIFPAFTLITNEDKEKINKKRYILRSMLNPYNRQKAKKDLIELVHYTNYEILIYDFEENNSQKAECFSWYSKECFYHNVINKGLRAFTQPEEYYYLRLIFSDLFTSILQKYQYEVNEPFICWRKSYINKSDYSKFKRNIGQYIELQGFISTSKDFSKVNVFQGNVLFEIRVPQKQTSDPNSELDNGYADISNSSWYKNENEVLFNAINYFQIVDIQEPKNSEYEYKITLEYCRISQIAKIQYGKRSSKQKQLLTNYVYQEKKSIRIQNQGDCFFQCGEYQKSLQWLNQKQVKIQQQFKKKFKVQITSKFSEEQEKKEFYNKYINLFFVRVSCLNNLKMYEQAYKQIQQCELLYQSMTLEKNENYFFILKAKGHIQLNCGKIAQGLKSLKKALLEFQKFLQINQKNSKKQERWKNKKKKDQFRDEIIATLRYWKDCENYALEEEIEKKLKQIQGTRGKKNVFYFTNLKNKFIILYEKNKWKEIIEEFKNSQKVFKNLSTNKKDINFLTYVACLSYLQVELVKEAQKTFEEFIQNLNKENENSIKISCTEVSMFLHLVITFVQKTYSQKYFDYLTELVKFQFCYADKLEEQREFQFRKENLMPFLFQKPKLMEAFQRFFVERSFDEV